MYIHTSTWEKVDGEKGNRGNERNKIFEMLLGTCPLLLLPIQFIHFYSLLVISVEIPKGGLALLSWCGAE